ncbi:MAG: inositol monophosphatase [Geminicoccaceae bacterium]|nr:inositol monophosphatase [Geminicoccaceae bacterium]
MNEIEERFEEAQRIARAAAALALDYFGRRDELEIEHKGKQDLVSIADKEVENLIRHELERLFPDDAILGEEGGGSDASRLWVIDPIDGTSNFLRGIPLWGVLLAYVVDGVTEIGITVLPCQNELYAARRGHGATCNGRPIRVSGHDRTEECCALISFSFKQPREQITEAVGRLYDLGVDQRRVGSSAVNLAWVADGRVDMVVLVSCNSWDCLPGLLLVEEAGGIATRYTADGTSLVDRRPVAACTPAIVAEVSSIQPGLGLER